MTGPRATTVNMIRTIVFLLAKLVSSMIIIARVNSGKSGHQVNSDGHTFANSVNPESGFSLFA